MQQIKKSFLFLFIFIGRVLARIFPRLRGETDRTGRQRFLIGKLAPGRTSEAFVSYLIGEKGFKENFPCWVDPGQVASLRLVDPKSGRHQYHVRLFGDREIRGHYEIMLKHEPLAHLLEQGMEERRNEFIAFLGDWVE